MFWVIFLVLWVEGREVNFRIHPVRDGACAQAALVTDARPKVLAIGIEVDKAVVRLHTSLYDCSKEDE